LPQLDFGLLFLLFLVPLPFCGLTLTGTLDRNAGPPFLLARLPTP
jgi:hypothetical protein